MIRECVRDDGFGRKCRGEIVSFTEEGFTLATCSICCLPAAAPKNGADGIGGDDGDGEERKKDASESKRGSAAEESESKKRQRI